MIATILFLGAAGKCASQQHEIDLIPPVGTTLILNEPGTGARKSFSVAQTILDLTNSNEATLVVHEARMGFDLAEKLGLANSGYPSGEDFEGRSVGDFIEVLSAYPQDYDLCGNDRQKIRLKAKDGTIVLSLAPLN